MKINVTTLPKQSLDINSQDIIILPSNYSSNENHAYNSSSVSFYKYSKNNLNIQYFSEPQVLIEQQSGDWFGPILFFTSAAVIHNPELVSIMCGVIANYVTDFFKGRENPPIHLKVMYKETKTTKVTEFTYEGNLEGLNQFKQTIEDIVNRSKTDE